MSVIGEECIGHGGPASGEEEEDAYEKNKNNPHPPSDNVNLDPALKEIKEIRQKSLENSKELLDAQGRRFEETKKLIENFRDKTAKYPKYISHEGSTVLCVFISVKTPPKVNITDLPLIDQQLIKTLVPEKYFNSPFYVSFDKEKDFELTFYTLDDYELLYPYSLVMFNSVIHPRLEDISDGQVKVENKGEKISVGGIVLDKKGIQKMIGIEPTQKNNSSDLPTRRQPVVGRNAYEIREDVLESAIDIVKLSNVSNKRNIDELSDEVLQVASKFYEFVENRRR